jgi:hypothetical protein
LGQWKVISVVGLRVKVDKVGWLHCLQKKKDYHEILLLLSVKLLLYCDMPTHRWMTQRSCYALAGKQFRADSCYDVTGVYVVAMTRAAILSQATVLEYGFYAEGSGDVTQQEEGNIA